MKKLNTILAIFNLSYITIMLFVNLVLLLIKMDWDIILYINIGNIVVYILNLNFMLINIKFLQKEKLSKNEVESLLEKWNKDLENNSEKNKSR